MKAFGHILTAIEVSKRRIRCHRGFSVGRSLRGVAWAHHSQSWVWNRIRACLAGRRAKGRWKSGLRTVKNDTEQQRQ